MKYKIVSDSSSNLFALEQVEYANVPLKIITDEKEYVDEPGLDIPQMIEELKRTKSKSGTSCPNAHEWKEAFGDADAVFATTITGTLSGSYAAAMQAREEYIEEHEGAKVCIIDSKSAGPELQLLMEKMREGILREESFEQIEDAVREYHKHTHLLFALQSLTNLSRNGRVNPAVAAAAGILGICIVGKASAEGTLEPMHKCRGERKALDTIVKEMKKEGYAGGKVRIAHCLNVKAAETLKEKILQDFPNGNVEILDCTGLCSFYAEKDGLMIGYEDANA